MTVSSGVIMKGHFNASVALGEKIVSSDATMVIEGHEHMMPLIKQFPWPELSPAGEIEVPLPLGGAMWQPQQIKNNQQGGITFIETEGGHVQEMLERLISVGGRFNATVYEGTPDNYKRKLDILRCFLQLDPPDRDMENRGQILLITGTLFYHYFGNQ